MPESPRPTPNPDSAAETPETGVSDDVDTPTSLPRRRKPVVEKRPRVFMLGWEFPPLISGGLGTACHGLTKALAEQRVDVTFVLPRPANVPAAVAAAKMPDGSGPTVETIGEDRTEIFDAPESVTIETIEAGGFGPYASPSDHVTASSATIKSSTIRGAGQPVTGDGRFPERDSLPYIRQVIQRKTDATPHDASPGESGRYAGDMFDEVRKYAELAVKLAGEKTKSGLKFDVVHAHDWMTFPAGLEVAAKLNVPLVVHVHSTEYDRSGDNADDRIADIERRGIHAAQRVIAVSHYTRGVIEHRFGVDAGRIDVIHNGIEVQPENTPPTEPQSFRIGRDEKLVLFLGRITMQKGPEYFIEAAQKVLEIMPDVRFVMAGNGDQLPPIVQRTVEAGLSNKILFTGFLRGSDVEAVFKLADLYVMPSVSEPFGIAPLEAMSHDVPVIISKTSGVSEVLKHALKVDFWDTDEMANKIAAVLKHPSLAGTLRREGALEVRSMRWQDAAERCKALYAEMIKPSA
ncbi:MAG: glycosyltransferase [Planctomycetota bacterium]